MSTPAPTPSRTLAIVLVVLTALAFVGILVGLAIGQLVVSGGAALALVVLWFVLRVMQKRGRD